MDHIFGEQVKIEYPPKKKMHPPDKQPKQIVKLYQSSSLYTYMNNNIDTGKESGNTGLFAVLGLDNASLKMVYFCFLQPFVKRCTSLTGKTYLSLKSIGIVKLFEKSLKSLK